jgi:hypothetical protein
LPETAGEICLRMLLISGRQIQHILKNKTA